MATLSPQELLYLQNLEHVLSDPNSLSILLFLSPQPVLWILSILLNTKLLTSLHSISHLLLFVLLAPTPSINQYLHYSYFQLWIKLPTPITRLLTKTREKSHIHWLVPPKYLPPTLTEPLLLSGNFMNSWSQYFPILYNGYFNPSLFSLTFCHTSFPTLNRLLYFKEKKKHQMELPQLPAHVI